MSVMTVCGSCSADDLGIILPHEHILIDLRKLVDRVDEKQHPEFYEKLMLENLRFVRRDPYAILDNTCYFDEEIALKELMEFRKSGGCTIVDVTLDEIARNPIALKHLSELSGVNIIMGCGHYISAVHDSITKQSSISKLADELIQEITVGFKDTEIKAGVIGEIGTSAVITSSEWNNVFAAGIASKETGKGIHFHTSLWGENGITICDKLLEQNVKPNKICINHIDVALNEEYLVKLLDKGVYIEYDNFGKEFYISPRADGILKGRFAYDLERARSITNLVNLGYEKQILISNDICIKHMFTAYGGNGFGHILSNIVPMLTDCGLSQKSIDRIIKQNPAEFLA